MHCDVYRYDSGKKMIWKELPGDNQVCIVYDKPDRLVLSQDGKMRDEDDIWLFFNYVRLFWGLRQ